MLLVASSRYVGLVPQRLAEQYGPTLGLRWFPVPAALPEVVEFYRMSGETDYLLKVIVRDIAAYDRFYKRLIAAAPLGDVSSSFAMEQIKYTTGLPLDYAQEVKTEA